MSDAVATPPATPPAAPATPAADPSTPAAPAAGTPPPAAPPPGPQKYKFDLKVDGKADSKEYTHDELVAMLQKNSAADRRLAQLADEKKAIAGALAKLKENPIAALSDPALGGINIKELVAQQLYAEWQQEELAKSDPVAAERQRLDQERAAYQKEVEAFRAQKQAEQNAALEQQIRNETLSTYQAAIQKLGVPADEDLVTTMLDLNLKALDYGLDLNADQLALAAKEHLEDRAKAIVGKDRGRWTSMEGEDLLKDLGDDTVKKVQAALLSRARAAVGKPAVPVTQKPGEGDDASKPKREFVSDSVVRRKLLWGNQ